MLLDLITYGVVPFTKRELDGLVANAKYIFDCFIFYFISMGNK